MAPADEARIRALVAAQNRGEDRRTVLAVRAEPRWNGPDVLDGVPPCRVVAAISPLAAREAIVRHTDRTDDELLVLLTECASVDLGLDLRAQLLKGEVQSFDPFSSVLALFGARVLDPALAGERWLIDDLIALAPAEGWSGDLPLNGVLTVERAWSSWQRARTGVESTPATLGALLDMADDARVRAGIAALGDEGRDRLARRWSTSAPSATALIVNLAADQAVASPTVLGLVVGVLWEPTNDPSLMPRQVLGRARLEAVLGRDVLTAADALAWGLASAERVARIDSGAGLVADAERVLAEVDGLELSVLSDVLPRGFEARIDSLGRALVACEPGAVGDALARVRRHTLAPRRVRRVVACQAAVRLLRRSLVVRAEGGHAGSFADLAVAYRNDLAWLEQARRDVAPGEQPGALAAVLGTLAVTATATQAEGAAVFATALVEWSKSMPVPDERIVPVEDLLGAVVAPVAEDAPVLLVVCDGMGLAVSHQLVAELRAEGWASAGPSARGAWPVGVAVLPTVTSASRTSLFSGRLVDGAQPQERAGFASHPALRRVGKPQRPPVLFHKAGLVAANGAALPEEIRNAVADPDQRIVGVVVNSVDDHLARGDQINVGWDLASLGPLAWLLDAAAEAGRVVILTADHGHVLDKGRSLARPQATEGGERWRTAVTEPVDGEVVIAGPRVVLGGGCVVLPVDERIRYGPPKHGYHGGATPEEVLVPVEVLARRLPPGWAYQPVVTPAWWDDKPPDRPLLGATTTLTPSVKPKVAPQPTLFEPVPAAPTPATVTWVDSLLASAAFASHRTKVRLPRPLADARLRRYLDAIAGNGGSISLASLSTLTGEPAGTLRMTLSVVQRLLNVDGTEVLAVRDDGSVACNTELLALQFDLPDMAPGR